MPGPSPVDLMKSRIMTSRLYHREKLREEEQRTRREEMGSRVRALPVNFWVTWENFLHFSVLIVLHI